MLGVGETIGVTGWVRHTTFGVGRIVARDQQFVTIHFPDELEDHTFNSETVTSLSRHRIEPGVSCTVGGHVAVVEKPMPDSCDGEYVYLVRFENGLTESISEVDIEIVADSENNCPILALADGETSGGIDLFNRWRELVHRLFDTQNKISDIYALLSCRIDIHKHQAFVAGTVIKDPVRRYILANEVGLGKTIEAWIILHDLLIKRPAANVLILCPGALEFSFRVSPVE